MRSATNRLNSRDAALALCETNESSDKNNIQRVPNIPNRLTIFIDRMIASQIVGRQCTLCDHRRIQIVPTIRIDCRIARVTRQIVGNRLCVAIVARAQFAQRRRIPAECVVFENVSQAIAHDRIIVQRIDQRDAIVNVVLAFGDHRRRHIFGAIAIRLAAANVTRLRRRLIIATASRAQFAGILIVDVAHPRFGLIQFTGAATTNRLAVSIVANAEAAVLHQIHRTIFAHVRLHTIRALGIVIGRAFVAVLLFDWMLIAIVVLTNRTRLRVP